MTTCATVLPCNTVRCLSADGPTLDSVRVNRLKNAIRVAIESGSRAIVVDMKMINQVDFMGLAGLIALRTRTHTRITLASLKPSMQDTALLVHLHELFDIYETPHDAARDLYEQSVAL